MSVLRFKHITTIGVVQMGKFAGSLDDSPTIGFGKYIISATTSFLPEDLAELRTDARGVLRKRIPEYENIYQCRGWKMFDAIDRVHVNERARIELKWEPEYDFTRVLRRLVEVTDPHNPLAIAVESKR